MRNTLLVTSIVVAACQGAPVAEVATALEEGGARACDPARFPSSVGPCCQQGDATWHVSSQGEITHRLYGTACRKADGVSTGCGVGASPCTYGPCGAFNQWTRGTGGGHVFVPESDPTVCGWQISDTEFSPEPYTDQTSYERTEAGCPYSRCLPDGRAVVEGFAFTITAVEQGATGSARTKEEEILVIGAGTGRWGYERGDVVTVTANGRGRDTRAVLSGACSATGDYGRLVRCDVAMTAARTVTVTYQCAPGESCEDAP